jgi:DNA-binding response OmpR family regulator
MSSDPIILPRPADEPDAETGHRVMVVEDNEHTAFLLEFILSRAGYSVLVARDGREAQAMRRTEEPVSLVLLDLMLPYVSGYQLLIDLRGDHRWMNVPVIVVSGKLLEMDVARALDLGADDYVTKPFRPTELLARIRRTLITHERIGQHG